jgi:hypothetical protein
MANELLDFVMSLVRDPGVAAQYAADPAQAIADAHLTDVTSADVNNLIPMVSDSLASFPGAVSSFGGDAATDHNVWTSGAATAAFDAFDAFTPHPGDLPDHATAAVHDLSRGVIDTKATTQTDVSQLGADLPGSDAVGGFGHFDPSTSLSELGVDPAAVDSGAFGVDDHGIDHGAFDQLSSEIHHLDADHSGFDVLN